jgi:hypothetical protein
LAQYFLPLQAQNKMGKKKRETCFVGRAEGGGGKQQLLTLYLSIYTLFVIDVGEEVSKFKTFIRNFKCLSSAWLI